MSDPIAQMSNALINAFQRAGEAIEDGMVPQTLDESARTAATMGLITAAEAARMTDGVVTSFDLHVARRVVNNSTNRYDQALGQALRDQVRAQLDAQGADETANETFKDGIELDGEALDRMNEIQRDGIERIR